MLKELTEEEKRIGKEKFNKEMEELKRKMDAGEDYQVEDFDIIEDERGMKKEHN